MEKEVKEKYDKLASFWDSVFACDENEIEEYKKSIKGDEWKEMAPSKKLFDACLSIANSKKVLDYGCGQGWASLIMACSGCIDITSVDVSKNAIKMLNVYKKLFNVEKTINAINIDDQWLKGEDSNKYDAVICSNVIDVLPFSISKEIIKEIYRITKANSTIIFSMNYYLDEEIRAKKGSDINEEGELFVDGILRLLNKSDEEWTNIFTKYFKLIKLEHFAWLGEKEERRRLFYLKKE